MKFTHLLRGNAVSTKADSPLMVFASPGNPSAKRDCVTLGVGFLFFLQQNQIKMLPFNLYDFKRNTFLFIYFSPMGSKYLILNILS